MRKKLFTIIMSVMMVAVFMPTMAFAYSVPGYAAPHDAATHAGSYALVNLQASADKASVTATVACGEKYCQKTFGNITVKAERVWDDATGKVQVKVKEEDLLKALKNKVQNQTIEAFDAYKNYDKDVNPADLDEYEAEDGCFVVEEYYDLNGAFLGTAGTDLDSSSAAYDEMQGKKAAELEAEYAALMDAVADDTPAEKAAAKLVAQHSFTEDVLEALGEVSLLLVQPSYTFDEDQKAKEAKVVAFNDEYFTIDPFGYEPFVEGNYSVAVKLDQKALEDAEVVVIGTPNAHKFHVSVDALPDATDLDEYFSIAGFEDEDTPLTKVYDGKAHALQCSLKGVKVEYSVWDEETEDVKVDKNDDTVYSADVPSFTNVNDVHAVYAKVTFVKGTEESNVEVEGIVVTPAITPAEFKASFGKSDYIFSDEYVVKAEDVVAVDCPEVDQAAFYALLNKYGFTNVLDGRIGTTPLVFNTDALLDEDTGIYEEDANGDLVNAFLGNYENIVADNFVNAASNGAIGVQSYVTITEAKENNFKQTIAKINAKKGVKKTVQLGVTKAAKGDVTWKKLSGNAKVTVSADGKLVVKKGLKKGTYKVKVKATAAGNYLYAEGSAVRTLKVVVK